MPLSEQITSIDILKKLAAGGNLFSVGLEQAKDIRSISFEEDHFEMFSFDTMKFSEVSFKQMAEHLRHGELYALERER